MMLFSFFGGVVKMTFECSSREEENYYYAIAVSDHFNSLLDSNCFGACLLSVCTTILAGQMIQKKSEWSTSDDMVSEGWINSGEICEFSHPRRGFGGDEEEAEFDRECGNGALIINYIAFLGCIRLRRRWEISRETMTTTRRKSLLSWHGRVNEIIYLCSSLVSAHG